MLVSTNKFEDLTTKTYSGAHDGCESLAEGVVRGGLLVRRGRSVGRGRRGRRCTRTMTILQRCRRRCPRTAVRRDRGTTPECRHWRQGSRTGHRRAQDRRCRFTVRRHRRVCLKPPSANGSTLGSCGNRLGAKSWEYAIASSTLIIELASSMLESVQGILWICGNSSLDLTGTQ